MPFEDYVDVLETARTLEIHPETVRRLIRKGSIRATLWGNKYWIKREDLESFASTYDPKPGRKAKGEVQ